MMVTAYNNMMHNNMAVSRSPDNGSVDYGMMMTGGLRLSAYQNNSNNNNIPNS
jgi:hypothetical protein